MITSSYVKGQRIPARTTRALFPIGCEMIYPNELVTVTILDGWGHHVDIEATGGRVLRGGRRDEYREVKVDAAV